MSPKRTIDFVLSQFRRGLPKRPLFYIENTQSLQAAEKALASARGWTDAEWADIQDEENRSQIRKIQSLIESLQGWIKDREAMMAQLDQWQPSKQFEQLKQDCMHTFHSIINFESERLIGIQDELEKRQTIEIPFEDFKNKRLSDLEEHYAKIKEQLGESEAKEWEKNEEHVDSLKQELEQSFGQKG